MNATQLDNLRNQIMPVLEPYGIQRVALFGSFARGEETPKSDMDLLVDFEEPRKKPFGLFAWIQVEEELSRRLGRKTDLVPAACLKKRIRPTVQSEMVIIYEKPRRPRTTSRHFERNKTNRVLSAGSQRKPI